MTRAQWVRLFVFGGLLCLGVWYAIAQIPIHADLADLLPKGATEVRFFAVRDTLGYPVVGEGIWRPDPFATTQILWDGSKLICNPEPPLP